MQQFTAEAIEVHKQIVNESEWLSDASRQRLCEKLDAITVEVVYPDVWEDYSGLDLEGLDYYEAQRAIWLNDLAINAKKTGTDIDFRLWENPSLMSGGAYHLENNSFHIDAAMCEDDVNRFKAGEITVSELMGSYTGYIVFHEIAHAIDTLNTPEFELMWILGADTHPTAVLNTNLTVQQFDEFADTYGVKEGDTMYLAPEDRIVIW